MRRLVCARRAGEGRELSDNAASAGYTAAFLPMDRFLFLFLMLGCAVRGWADEPAISVTDLLRPETRLRAYHEFKLRADPERMKRLELMKLEEFEKMHSHFSVTELRGAKDGVHYLASWEYNWSASFDERWKDAKPAVDPEVRPPTTGAFQLFASDGKPLSKEVLAFQSVVLDLDGDGVPEVIQRQSVPIFDPEEKGVPVPIPGLAAVGESRIEYELLKVCRLDPETPSSFALLFNANPSDRLPGNLWGFQVRRVVADGSTVIELGPLRVPEGIEPKVVFRWDKAKRAWVGPKPRPDDHWLELKAGDETADAQRVAARGGLRYPLVGPGAGGGFRPAGPDAG